MPGFAGSWSNGLEARESVVEPRAWDVPCVPWIGYRRCRPAGWPEEVSVRMWFRAFAMRRVAVAGPESLLVGAFAGGVFVVSFRRDGALMFI